jgi:peptide deformylase
MALTIAQLGQPVLRQKAVPVSAEELSSPVLQQLIDDMLETMTKENGAGLAGPQVFQSKRLFVARILPTTDPDEIPGVEVLVNPRIVAASVETSAAWEGCLSFPELLVKVARPLAVRIEFVSRGGEARVRELQGLRARVVLHEQDHLDGILTIDRAASTLDIVKASEIEANR